MLLKKMYRLKRNTSIFVDDVFSFYFLQKQGYKGHNNVVLISLLQLGVINNLRLGACCKHITALILSTAALNDFRKGCGH